MKNFNPYTMASEPPAVDVVVLMCPHQLHFDPAPMTHLFKHKEHHEAEEIVCHMLEDIAVRLDMLQQGLRRHEFELMVRPARRIEMVAERMGLVEVAVSASHVCTCLTQQDGIALEAVLARLERGFDVAVNEVWNFREM